jgi:hypothetical protein
LLLPFVAVVVFLLEAVCVVGFFVVEAAFPPVVLAGALTAGFFAAVVGAAEFVS